MILILCDPLGRLEKAFMFHLYCFQGNLAEAKQQGLASNFTFLGSPRDDTCFDSASVLLTERDGELKSFWQHAEVAVHVPNLAQLFRGRMILCMSLYVLQLWCYSFLNNIACWFRVVLWLN